MINVLSLFDGLGGARIALDQLGIECQYFASEIDKYAMKVSAANYPDIIQLGDVRDVKASNLPKIDLLIGGSPCQDLSIAKSGREGLQGERSGLFWEYVRLWKELKPRYFVLENVYSMPKESQRLISKTMGVSPIMINSALLTAQNRKRYYWTNTGVWLQPADQGIVLADIIEDNKNVKGCALRTYPRIPEPGIKREKRLELRSDNKLNALTGAQTDSLVGIYTVPRGFNKGGARITNKAPTLTANSYDHNNKFITNPIKIGHLGNNAQSGRIYSVYGKSVTLCAGGGGGGAKAGLYYIFDTIRPPTVTEYARLQGVPDKYTDKGVSKTQQKKMLANGFTIPVIKHILKEMNL